MRLATSQVIDALATQNEGWVPPIPAATATLSKLSESDIVTTTQLSEGVVHKEERKSPGLTWFSPQNHTSPFFANSSV